MGFSSSRDIGYTQCGGRFDYFCENIGKKDYKYAQFYGKIKPGVYPIESKKLNKLVVCDTSNHSLDKFVLVDCPRLKSLDGHGPEIILISSCPSFISFCGKSTKMSDIDQDTRKKAVDTLWKQWKKVEESFLFVT